MLSFDFDQLHVSVFEDRTELGSKGAELVSNTMKKILKQKDELNMIFASAPSQMDIINELLTDQEIDWNKINAFHMDEYIGLPSHAPQSFGHYLRERLFNKKQFKNVFYINGNSDDLDAECKRYADLLMKYPCDISMLGIGENGHLAFNDPGIADFNDPIDVKVNWSLDDECIQQQVNDGWFEAVADVPKSAITVTIPALVRPKYLFTTVPAKSKAEIIKKFFESEIDTRCPATIIRKHPESYLFLDRESSKLIDINVLSAGQVY